MNNEIRYISEIVDFIHYLDEFYHIERGVYKLFNDEQILTGVMMLISNNKFNDICYDSIDREKVRGYLDPNYSMI